MADNKATIADLKFDPRNARRRTERSYRMIQESIQEVGLARSIVIDEDGVILAGNGTVECAGQIGIDRVRIIDASGDEIIAVRRSGLTPEQKQRLALYDNRTADLAEWDPEMLARLQIEGAELDAFWSEEELQRLMDQVAGIGGGDQEEAPEPEIDRVEELREKWSAAYGQLWQIGRHRLLCGDSTKKQDVERVLGGARPKLMVTDPPYGVEYDPKWRHEAAEMGLNGFSPKRSGKVANDDRVDWTEAWMLFPGDVCYVWHADRRASEVQQSLATAGFEIRSQIIWAKDSFSISRGHYHWQHEPCWYAIRRGRTASWVGDHSQSTLWKINKSDGDDQGTHGTQKPLECMQRPIHNHEGDVYDPFCGSGTTIVAAERENRTCYAIEIDPGYIGVILERLSQMGLKPELIESA